MCAKIVANEALALFNGKLKSQEQKRKRYVFKVHPPSGCGIFMRAITKRVLTVSTVHEGIEEALLLLLFNGRQKLDNRRGGRSENQTIRPIIKHMLLGY